MKHYGIVGKPLEHSFSAQWFATMFEANNIDADYDVWELMPQQVLQRTDVSGFNVTYPYKQSIIPLLNDIDPVAQEIGAVNTVKYVNGIGWKGYNTDWLGFTNALQQWFGDVKLPDEALILGTGGAAQAVVYALQKLNITCHKVSRNATKGITYNDLTQQMVNKCRLVVNCTPLGMYPSIDTCPPFPYDMLGSKHYLYDCIYNPEKTLFMQEGELRGAHLKNGYTMLVAQAQEAWKIWQLE